MVAMYTHDGWVEGGSEGPQTVGIILDNTGFYAEAGGQVRGEGRGGGVHANLVMWM